MKQNRDSFLIEKISQYLVSALVVGCSTGLLLLIGRDQLGEAVIALLLLVPVGWSAGRWGQGPGIFAALMAALAFDFFFIPPFYTFTVGNLEGWLVLAIFLAVAILVVGRIENSLSKARTSEREAILMYELSSALAGLRTQEAVAYTVARFLQQAFMARQVTVFIQSKGQTSEISASEPRNSSLNEKPGCILPLLNNWGLVGEVQIWASEVTLPSTESRIFRNFVSQIGQTIERTQLTENGAFLNASAFNANVK